MFKKVSTIFLCCAMLLTGCTNNVPNASADSKIQINGDAEGALLREGGLSLVWKDQSDYFNVGVEFSPIKYTPKVPEYSIHPDLSNIKNISRFEGLSKEQSSKLANNGFVVLNPNPEKAYYYMKMYDIYEENEYKSIPNFITVDVALHIYHKFYDELLKGLEKEELYQVLQQLTQDMLQKTLAVYSETENQTLKDYLGDVVVYFSVANKLINDSYGNVPEELSSIAKKEMNEIENATGYAKSPLFGFDINYEQFTVRGHYTGDEILQRYFKTMMWYGLIGYPLEDKNPDFDSITKAMMITYISFLEMDGHDDIALWDKIYAPTYFLVGQSDDITIFDLKEVIINTYGEHATLEDFLDEQYHGKLLAELEKLPAPQIQHKLITGSVDTPSDKQFRFMGQRYTLDGNILQEFMFPIVRPVPTGLDVAGAFGSQRAESLVTASYLKGLEEEQYRDVMTKMKSKVESLDQSDWTQNLYNGWLWVLKSLWTKPSNTQGLPIFMKNQAWEDKNLSSGLGSYAELKHDTVLYAKQPVAEMGGGEELGEDYPNYVEPAVEVYDKLLWLVRYSQVNLKNKGLLSERTESALNSLEEVYELFRTCAVKELENIPISEEENRELKYIGGKLEYIDDTLSDQYRQSISSAVVSDVAGIADIGAFLEIGTGLPNEILVALYQNGKVYLARGAVYSYYEFLSEKPLTDEEWHRRLGVEKIEEDEWHYEQINPERLQKDAPPQPQWISSFKSFEENKVIIPAIEYNLGQ
ncbi:DUF3160 domain-containing protein [Defluviitalea saccharophila]|uniref:DUF3160 domain-containing protein n=1 Tax=Defluviitalea saccharophila TaxID=879970 RepID=A0ABZ2Y6V1_9FIRM